MRPSVILRLAAAAGPAVNLVSLTEVLGRLDESNVLRLALDPANRPAQVQAPRRERVWRPAPSGAGNAARVVLRHPSLARVPGIPEVPSMRVGRSSRSIDRGTQAWFPSMKTGRSLRAASRREREHMLHCELAADVAYFHEQPVWIEYRDGARLVRHKPDLLVVRRGAVELVEARPEASAGMAENEARWEVIGSAIAAMGVTYRVVSESDTLAEPRWTNMNAVWRDRHAEPPDAEVVASILGALRGRPPATVAELVQNFPMVSRKGVHAMVRRGMLLGSYDGPVMVTAPRPGQAFPTRAGAI